MYTSKNLTDEEIEAQWSSYSEDDLYPEDDVPYSCAEEAEAVEANNVAPIVIRETNPGDTFEWMLERSITQHKQYIEKGEENPQSPLEMISSEFENQEKAYYYQLIDLEMSPLPPVRIELVDMPQWNEHSLPIFVSELASVIESDWDVTVIWLRSYSKPEVFKVIPASA
ncbi:MAG: hypothetical protein AB3N14_09740 [Flavobacteriaceae bacterium]